MPPGFIPPVRKVLHVEGVGKDRLIQQDILIASIVAKENMHINPGDAQIAVLVNTRIALKILVVQIVGKELQVDQGKVTAPIVKKDNIRQRPADYARSVPPGFIPPVRKVLNVEGVGKDRLIQQDIHIAKIVAKENMHINTGIARIAVLVNTRIALKILVVHLVGKDLQVDRGKVTAQIVKKDNIHQRPADYVKNVCPVNTRIATKILAVLIVGKDRVIHRGKVTAQAVKKENMHRIFISPREDALIANQVNTQKATPMLGALIVGKDRLVHREKVTATIVKKGNIMVCTAEYAIIVPEALIPKVTSLKSNAQSVGEDRLIHQGILIVSTGTKNSTTVLRY